MVLPASVHEFGESRGASVFAAALAVLWDEPGEDPDNYGEAKEGNSDDDPEVCGVERVWFVDFW